MVVGLPGWIFPASAAVVSVGLALFGVFSYTNANPHVITNTQSAPESVIPVLDPGDEESPANRSGDTSTPAPVPTLAQSPLPAPEHSPLPTTPTLSSSEASKGPTDPWLGERMEAASKSPVVVEESKKPDRIVEEDDLLGGAIDDQASRPADSVPTETDPSLFVPSEVDDVPLEEDAATLQDFAQPPSEQDTGVSPQQAPALTSPPASPTGTETSLPPPTGTTTPSLVDSSPAPKEFGGP